MCERHAYAYLWINNELTTIDSCLAFLVLQLNLAGIKTVNSCCSHGKGYPNVLCEEGTEEKLREFGCKIVTTRRDGLVEAYFPVNTFGGKFYPVQHDEKKS